MLKARKKLTKKELKHDPLLDALESSKDFVEDNKQQIGLAAGAVVGVLLVGWMWMSSQTTTNNAAMLANTKSMIAMLSPTPAAVDELENAVLDFGNNKNIGTAKLELAAVYIDSGNIAGAKDLLDELASSSDIILKEAGQLKLAYVAELEGDYATASKLYMKVADKAKGVIAKTAKLQAGYAYNSAGNKAMASQIAEELAAESPTGKFKESIEYLQGLALEK